MPATLRILGALSLLVSAVAGATLSVTKGTAADKYVITGRVVTPDEVVDSKVIVEGDTITCVGSECAEPEGANLIRVTNAYVLPGFIDAHNHTAYNVFPKWQPPKLYGNRYQWQASTSYKSFKAPYNALKSKVYCEMVKYSELRALISGVTTIQGTSPNYTCFRTLIRNAENHNELGLSANHIRTHILPINGFTGPVNWNETKAFVVHLGEGIDDKSRNEFTTLKQKNLLRAETVIIHGTAFGATEFEEMAAAGSKLIWSPQSNLVLYGKTTDIKTALQKGVKVSLGMDWNPTGSNNLFDELRVASSVNEETFDGAIGDDEWLKMITVYPAQALALDEKVGSITVNRKADITVIRDRDTDVNKSLLKNQPQDIQLVMVGGKVLYGNQATVEKLRPNECEALVVYGSQKRICVKDPRPGVANSSQTLSQIKQALQSRYSGLAPLAP